MADLKLSSFAIDTTRPLKATKAYFIREEQSGLKPISSLVDISTAILGNGPLSETTSLHEAGKIAAAKPNLTTLFTLKQSGLLPTKLEAHPATLTVNAETTPLAIVSLSLLGLGKYQIAFPSGSEHSSHEIDMKPAGVGSHVYPFVKDSVPFFWDIRDAEKGDGRVYELWKVVAAIEHSAAGEEVQGGGGSVRIPVANFAARRPRDREGLLLVDEGHVDVFIAGLTCALLLRRMDSF
jgi:hypothetical protein